MAQLFLTVFAGKASIGMIGKALGVAAQRDLPAHQKQQRHSHQTPCIAFRDKDQRREHHREIPVIDPANGAASIFHDPNLEWAEKQNADHVTYAVKQADQHHDPAVDDTGKIQ